MTTFAVIFHRTTYSAMYYGGVAAARVCTYMYIIVMLVKCTVCQIVASVATTVIFEENTDCQMV